MESEAEIKITSKEESERKLKFSEIKLVILGFFFIKNRRKVFEHSGEMS